jgi:hypothetical protein
VEAEFLDGFDLLHALYISGLAVLCHFYANVMYKMKSARDRAPHASFQVSVCLPHSSTFQM